MRAWKQVPSTDVKSDYRMLDEGLEPSPANCTSPDCLMKRPPLGDYMEQAEGEVRISTNTQCIMSTGKVNKPIIKSC